VACRRRLNPLKENVGMTIVSKMMAAAAAFLAMAGAAAAQDFCLPKSTWAPIDLQGGVLMEGRDNQVKGDWSAIWCPTTELDPSGSGRVVWRLRTFAVLDKYKSVDASTLAALTAQVLSAPNPGAAIREMLAARSIIPPAGTQDRFDWETLLFQACTQGVALPPGAGPTQVLKNTCKAPDPVPPTAPAPAIYMVTSTQAFPLKADGTRSISPIAAKPTRGEICDCTGVNRIVQYGATFCKVPSLSTTQTIVAGCSLKKP